MPDIRRLLQRAIRLAGGTQAALGEAIGCSQNGVFEAHRRGSVTAEMARDIHVATGGEVPQWELRPDLWRAGQLPPSLARRRARAG
jgi:DNA-binding transcriptional regulator YdaS (Cro superfamily)